MGRALKILLRSAALVTVGLVLSATALAQGTGTSAGDQQYVDPLSGSTATSSARAPSTRGTPSTPPSSAPASGASSPAPSTSAATPTTTSTASSRSTPSGTLPFTGLNLEVYIVIGMALVGAGLLLRWIATRA